MQYNNFIQEYIKDLNAVEAAIRAGYERSYAEKNAERILNNPEISRRVRYAIKDQLNILSVKKAYIIQELVKVARFSLWQEEVIDKDGTKRLKIRDISSGLKALDMLSKYLTDTAKQTGDAFSNLKFIKNLDEDRI